MPATAAERQRRRRQRIRDGRVRIVIEVDETVADALLALVGGVVDCDDQRTINKHFGLAVEKLARKQVEAALAKRVTRYSDPIQSVLKAKA